MLNRLLRRSVTSTPEEIVEAENDTQDKSKDELKKNRKARDRLRLKEQQERRKLRELKKRESIWLQRKSMQRTALWQMEQKMDQEFEMNKYALDSVEVAETTPIAAGYCMEGMLNANGTHCNSMHPVFMGASALRLNSRYQEMLNTQKIQCPEIVHPAAVCFQLFFSSECVSSAFWGLQYHKKCASDLLKDEFPEDISFEDSEAVPQENDYIRRRKVLQMMQTLRGTDGCLICVSSNAPGCPGCFRVVKVVEKLSYVVEKKKEASPFLRRRKGNIVLDQGSLRKLKRVYTSLSVAEAIGDVDYDMEDSDEDSNQTNMLHTRIELEKWRAKNKYYIEFLIKAVPGGSAIKLRLDTKDTIGYLYDLYRCNFEDPNRKIYLLLPTSHGIFYLDNAIENSTATTLSKDYGNFVLEDYKLNCDITQTIVLLSACVIHPVNTPRMLQYYVRNNFRIQTTVDFTFRLYANQVSPNLASDELQRMMANEAIHLMEASTKNKLLTLEYDKLCKKKKIDDYYKAKLEAKVEAKAAIKGHVRTRAELRAWMYFKYAIDEEVLVEKLDKLYNCFQKFEELRLIKKGKILESVACDDNRELLQQHAQHTVETFSMVLGSHGGRLLYPIVYLKSNKMAMVLGKRRGIADKEDKFFGLRVHGHDSPDKSPTKKFDDIEWSEKAVIETMAVASSTLLPPFYKISWRNIAAWYIEVLKFCEMSLKSLEEFNILVEAVQEASNNRKADEPGTIGRIEAVAKRSVAQGAMVKCCKHLKAKIRANRKLLAKSRKSKKNVLKPSSKMDALLTKQSTRRIAQNAGQV